MIPSIASQIANGQFIPAEIIAREVNPKRRDANKAVPGKGLPYGPDPLWQLQNKAGKIKGKEPILTFEAASSNVTPTDPTGAVGPNHFVNAWNSAFRIWDKAGNSLTPVASLATIFPGQTMGDPIVMYDPFADRFLITEFYPNGFLVAVSQGPDPVNNGWYTYQYPQMYFRIIQNIQSGRMDITSQPIKTQALPDIAKLFIHSIEIKCWWVTQALR